MISRLCERLWLSFAALGLDFLSQVIPLKMKLLDFVAEDAGNLRIAFTRNPTVEIVNVLPYLLFVLLSWSTSGKGPWCLPPSDLDCMRIKGTV
jgi:hypothetical protein